jgi:hypothetical protein
MLAVMIVGCGKKTDPIPKSAMVDLSPVAAVFLSVTDEGVLIESAESENILIEKGVSDGESCSFYNFLTQSGPKSSFLDKDVVEGQKYFYRIKKKTVKYGLTSSPVVFQITYAKPLRISGSAFTDTEDGYAVSISSDDDFMRMDVYSGGKSIIQTGKTDFFINKNDVKNSKITLVLTDMFGNKGKSYSIEFPVVKPIVIPQAVTNLQAAWLGESLRIVWDDVENAEYYDVKVCENVSCETVTAKRPYTIYKKEIKECADITVTAVNGSFRSNNTTVRYCRQEY